MVALAERFGNSLESAKAVVEGVRPTIWTCMPGIVDSFDPVAVTVSVQIAIKYRSEQDDGSIVSAPITLLTDVPVEFPRGGGYTLTFPIAQGDECVLVFASRSIDSWWQSGGVQEPVSSRMHDLSDAFCRVGPQSQARKISGISTTTAQLRSDDGLTFVEIDKTNGVVRAKSPTQITLDSPIVNIPQGVLTGLHFSISGGNIHATGTITADVDVVANTIKLIEHWHIAQGATAATTAARD